VPGVIGYGGSPHRCLTRVRHSSIRSASCRTSGVADRHDRDHDAGRDVSAKRVPIMYETLLSRRTPLNARLRRSYAMRLVKEPLVSREKVADLTPLRCPRDVYTFMQPFADQEAAETMWALPLNSQHCCRAPVVITRGILNSSLVHPREVFRAMVVANAAAIILCHNHPSGDPSPSPDDRQVTSQLVAAGTLLDIPVHDHVIIGDGRYCSFAEAGLL
jgi:hypothetical protein